MNKNTAYELLAQEIYQNLLNEENITVSVEHNVNIQGKSTKHQIDVYWKYKVAGIEHKVAIECKNYSKRVSIGQVRDFYSVLNDIGGTIGIMVTKNGFQKGALTFAEANGINVVILREPIDHDWKNRIKYMSTTIEAISIVVSSFKIDLDLDWVKLNFPTESLKNFEFKLSGFNNEIWIISPNGEKVKNLMQIEESLPVPKTQRSNIKHYANFENHFIETNKYGDLKIKGIEYVYDIHSTVSNLETDLTSMVKAIVKDALSNKITFIKK